MKSWIGAGIVAVGVVAAREILGLPAWGPGFWVLMVLATLCYSLGRLVGR